ncbi:MAG TPA: Flp family type IVb pilin [Mycobacteriales bacterium]|jgi:Flp pilus assembly pilin Flp|nr:Flp family type IVb pilin [Mycobacteriales bacterium]
MRARRQPDEQGATAVEYALMTFFITVVIAMTVGLVGEQLSDVFALAVDMFTP